MAIRPLAIVLQQLSGVKHGTFCWSENGDERIVRRKISHLKRATLRLEDLHA
jgi:hypothetical protein